MDSSHISALLDKMLLVVTFAAGLFAEWFRQRLMLRSEEKKHIGRVISDLLELRYKVLGLRELPKRLPEILPKQFRDQVPHDLWQSIDFTQFLPADDKLAERYRKAVDEIAGFRPFLAYRLRGKEIYFDLRKGVSQHFSQLPGSPIVANQITEILDREYLPVLEETLSLIARCHSFRTVFTVKRALRRRSFEGNLVPPEVQKFFEDLIQQLPSAANAQIPKEGNRT